MKKVFTTIVTVILVAAIALGALIAYDEYIQRRDRINDRIEHCQRNDEIFAHELNALQAQNAIGYFSQGYTVDVTFTYYEGKEQYRATWYNICEDTLANLLTNNYRGMKDVHVEKIERDQYVEQYASWRGV